MLTLSQVERTFYDQLRPRFESMLASLRQNALAAAAGGRGGRRGRDEQVMARWGGAGGWGGGVGGMSRSWPGREGPGCAAWQG